MAHRYLVIITLLSLVFVACKAEKPVEQKKPAPLVIVKPKPRLLSQEQREELDFGDDVISLLELAAGSEAEPFVATMVLPSENMKGEKGFETGKLVGFSVRTKRSEDIIKTYRSQLRSKGYLIFKSHKGYGSTLPDIVTVIKGRLSYDILKLQGTEAPNYNLDTKAIIAWLREHQKQGEFVITGAGPDWLEARFIKTPANMKLFAKQVVQFAPDVLEHGPQTTDKLIERMKRANGFSMVWD